MNFFSNNRNGKEIKNNERKIKEDEIFHNLKNIEKNIRNVIMFVFHKSDDELIHYIKNKNKIDWIEKWKNLRLRSLKNDIGLIHFSDLSELITLFSRVEKDINGKINDETFREKIEEVKILLNKYTLKIGNNSANWKLDFETDEEIDYISSDF